MNADHALNELEDLAKKLDVEVCYHQLTGEGSAGGGICKVRGKWRVIIERRASASEKASLLARCLARFDIEEQFISPAVRRLIEHNRL